MTKPDFEKMIRYQFKDKYGYIKPAFGRTGQGLMDAAFNAGLERAAEIAERRAKLWSDVAWSDARGQLDECAHDIRAEKEPQ